VIWESQRADAGGFELKLNLDPSITLSVLGPLRDRKLSVGNLPSSLGFSCSSVSANWKTNGQYRPDIDGLRAIAVLLVVTFHAFPTLVRGGLIGVDVFFVVSGFLITTIIFESLSCGEFSLLTFYQRRIRRIFPALLVVLISCLAIGWFVMLPDAYANLAKQIVAAAAFSSNLLLWNESSYFDTAERSNPLLHLWSLGVEEQFYLAWPLVVAFVWMRKLSMLRVALSVGVISFCLNVMTAQTHPIADFYSPFTRAWELLVGSLLATTPRVGFKKTKFRRNIWSTIGAALILLAAVVVSQTSVFPGWWALLPVIGAALVIAAEESAWLNRKVLANPAVVSIGRISYSIYLWHWPLLTFASYSAAGTPSSSVRVAMIVLSILLALGTYRLVESPLRYGKGGRWKAGSLVSAMAVMAVFGFATNLQGGLPSRFPPIVKQLTDYAYGYQRWYREGSCFLRPDQDASAFVSCADPNSDRKVLFLWGDSHAAHLYPGYSARGDINIVQRNASACPPLIGFSSDIRPFCKSINDYDLALIRRLQPSKVVLSAAWSQYDWPSYIERTVEQLRNAKVHSIIVVGPTPRWNDQLAKVMYDSFRTDPLHTVPKRLIMTFKPDIFDLDRKLREVANQLGVDYISPLAILCDQDGCLTSPSDDALMQWDSSHLTAEGSRYLVGRFPSY
jgi:peptidoglycan/LPS O-acetylase OafA/YrhL